MEKPLVYILLATYNGGQYLETQLDSIVIQSYTNWVLLIRDDNSSDNTLSIIESFVKKDKRIRVVANEVQSQSKGGACQNFAQLLNFAVEKEASFIMFADQDDYWFTDKVEKMINAMKKDPAPAMLYSSFIYADDNLNELPENVQNIKLSFLKPSFKRLIVQNTVYGCTVMINYSMAKKCLPIPFEAENHDYWITLIATGINANIEHLDIPLMLYRQHGNNVSGNFNDHSNTSRIKRFFNNWEGLKKVQWERIKMMNLVVEQMEDDLVPTNLELLKGYLNSIKDDNINLVRFCIKSGLKRHSFISTIVFYLVLCTLPKVEKKK